MDEQRKRSGSESSKFNPMVMCNSLERSVRDHTNLTIDDYLIAYKELNKFFHLLGSVFSFVANDVENKIEILEQYSADPSKGAQYKSFQSMIQYEEDNNLLKDPKTPSGARTALRLHRALKFFSKFMKELSGLDNKSGSGPVARECYKQTLAKYHPWYIQKSASLAMYALPTKEQLVEKAFEDIDVCGDEKQSLTAADNMNKLSQVSEMVYNAVEKLYAEKGLLDLP